MVIVSSTTSPSEDFMWVTTRSSVKLSLAIPSKHFLRWGCTLIVQTIFNWYEKYICMISNTLLYFEWTHRIGSLVSERISSSSSLDKKKNLGKYKRFFSRYAFNPRCTISSKLLDFFNLSSIFSIVITSRTRGSVNAAFIISFHIYNNIECISISFKLVLPEHHVYHTNLYII